MGRLTMQEVIDHCEKTAKRIEDNVGFCREWLGAEPRPLESKNYLEHKQTAEWLKELQRYKDLEEQGRLIEVPCTVGDIIYRINPGAKYPIIPMGVVSIELKGITNTFKEIKCKDCAFGGENYYRFTDIGKTVFLDKAEAEAKLEEMEGK